MISVYLDDIRRADVVGSNGFNSVVLRVGARDKVALVLKDERQANMLMEAINAAVDPDAPVLDARRWRGHL